MKKLKVIIVLLISIFININIYSAVEEEPNNDKAKQIQEKLEEQQKEIEELEKHLNYQPKNEIEEKEIETQEIIENEPEIKESSIAETDIPKNYLLDTDRNNVKNYGVNKKWKINSSNLDNVLNTKYVDSSYKIYDFSNVLTNEEEEELKNKALEFQKKYNTELIIVIDNLRYSYDDENEDYIADFYDYNDFGLDYKKYNGIVLFRNTYEYNPYYDIYTFGDAQLYFEQYNYDYILDNIYDELHLEYYLNGFNHFIEMINERYESGIPSSMKNYKVTDDGYLYDTLNYKVVNGKIVKIWHPPYIAAFVISLVASLTTIAVLVKKNKMVKKATNAGQYIDNQSIKFNESYDRFVRSNTSSYTVSSSSGSSGGGGGHSSHSGSSGGGHSSGGGRHG